MDPSIVHDDPTIPPPGVFKRFFAWFMKTCSPKADVRFKDRKEKLFKTVRERGGVVAEVGCGSAPNLKYYAAGVDHIVGVDFNAAMRPYALESAVAAGVPAGKLQLVVGRAEALPLPDASVDAVVATHLMCTVANVPQALREVLRVLRPGGKYVFLEHVAAPGHTRLHSLQHWLDPLWGVVGDGCHVTRDTLSSIQAAGFSSVEAESFQAELPWVGRMLAPHVAGIATK